LHQRIIWQVIGKVDDPSHKLFYALRCCGID